MKLNLGAGKDIRKGYVNVDCRDLPGIDWVWDLSRWDALAVYEGKDVEHILARDILEHFPQGDVERILKSWVDLLSPGGTITIQCPDVRHAASVMDDKRLIRLLYGAQDYPENHHTSGFTLATMTALVASLGLLIDSKELTKNGNMVIHARKKL